MSGNLCVYARLEKGLLICTGVMAPAAWNFQGLPQFPQFAAGVSGADISFESGATCRLMLAYGSWAVTAE